MGYRSEVEFYIQGEKTPALWQKFVTENQFNSNINWVFNTTDNQGIRFIPEKNTIHFKYDQIKFYSSYEDIKALINLWEEAQELSEEANLTGEFIRIGEEYDDIEVNRFGNHTFLLDVSCYIDSQIPSGMENEVTSVR